MNQLPTFPWWSCPKSCQMCPNRQQQRNERTCWSQSSFHFPMTYHHYHLLMHFIPDKGTNFSHGNGMSSPMMDHEWLIPVIWSFLNFDALRPFRFQLESPTLWSWLIFKFSQRCDVKMDSISVYYVCWCSIIHIHCVHYCILLSCCDSFQSSAASLKHSIP